MKYIIALCLLFLTNIGLSQQATLKGNIVGDENLVQLGQIKIFALPDSNFVKGALLDSSLVEVNFKYNERASNRFYAVITIPEYSDTTVNFTVEYSVGNLGIVNLEKNVDLDEVTVTYKKPTFKRTMDGVSVNVEGTELQTLTNLFEVLKASPQLTSPDDESIEIIGKGSPLILIDRQAVTSNQELKAVPAAQIEKIEIITHPSAKYKAEGSGGGVIEVYTKDFHLEGYNMTIRSQVGINTKNKPTTGAHVGLSLKKKKFTLSTYLGGNYNASFDESNNSGVATDDSQREMSSERTGEGYNFWQYYNIKSSYNINDKQKLSVGFNGNGSNGRNENNGFANYSQNGSEITSNETNTNGGYTWLNNSAFANYTIETDTFNSVLEFNLNYVNKVSNRDSESEGLFSNFITGSESGFNIKNVSKDIPNLGEFRVNYDHYFDTTQWKVSVGGSASLLLNGKTFDQSNLIGNEWVIDNSFSNSYDYSEYNGALYGEVSKKWNMIGFRLGIRGEYTKLYGFSNSLNQKFMDSTYILPFPNASVLIEPNDKVGITLYYNSGINRPQFSNFDPFIRQSDSLSIAYGNPYLLPTITHSAGIDLNLFYAYNFSVSYNLYEQPISELSFVKEGSFVVETTPWNALKQEGVNANLGLPIQLDWLSGWNSIWVDYSKYSFTSEFNREPLYNLTYGFYSYLTFTLPKDFTITNRFHLNKWGGDSFVNKAWFSWGGRVSKKYKGGNLQFFLDVGNIIPQKSVYTSYAGNFLYTGSSQWSYTTFKLGFFVKFGRLKANAQIQESSSGQSDRL